jgi:hypothetical protein
MFKGLYCHMESVRYGVSAEKLIAKIKAGLSLSN